MGCNIQKAKLLLADFLLEQKFNRMMRAVKANFNPAQRRVPAGNSDGGQWTAGQQANGNTDFSARSRTLLETYRSNDFLVLVGSGGTPGNNQAQNKQVDDVVRILRLTKDQRRALHREISGQNAGYHEILQIARDKFGK